MTTDLRTERTEGKRTRARVGTTRIVGPIGRFDQRQTAQNIAAREEVASLGTKVARKPSMDPLQRTFNSPAFKENALIQHLLEAVDGPVNPDAYKVKDPAWMSRRVKDVARFLGADLVGITELDESFVYSHHGGPYAMAKGEEGKEIQRPHRYAISVAKAMRVDLLKTSPSFLSGSETGLRYYDLGVIVCELAAYIREMGFPARGHHYRREEVLHVPIAVEAGLGELGRNGFLITREYGPRVRLATVTTDLPLAPDSPADIGAQLFCTICKKCATACPSQSIPKGDKVVTRGVEKWQIEAASCRKYWKANPQKWDSCISCIKTCPWNKPLTWWHMGAVWAVGRSSLAGKLLLWMDDTMYGRNPQYKALKAKLLHKYTEYP